LTAKEIQEQRSQLTYAWEIHNQEIRIHFEFRSYEKTMEFVNAVAKIADEADHHPDIFISYNKVKILLITHDLGEISEKDYALAKEIKSLEV